MTTGQAADGVAFDIHGCNLLGSTAAQFGEGATLHDGEERLMITVKAVAVLVFGLLITFVATIEPTFGQTKGLFCVCEIGLAGRTFVESHHDVGTDDALDVHHAFGCEHVL